jgi:hypothetical protein
MGKYTYSEIPLDQLKIFLKAFRQTCHMCGASLTFANLGYVRVGKDVELMLCEECLKDYAEYLETGEGGRRY